MTGASGGRRRPGELETTILAALGAADAPLTPGEVRDRLSAGGVDLAYTSVMTTLGRMHTKGLLERQARGRAYAYLPAAAAADAAAEQMRALLGAGRARTLVLSRFVSSLAPEDERWLTELLAAQRPHPGDG